MPKLSVSLTDTKRSKLTGSKKH